MAKYVFLLASIILIITLISCEEYEIKERTNPYDEENPWGRKVISVVPLTQDGVSDYPSWSPDETKIAYYNRSDRSIYVMDAAGKSFQLPLVSGHKWEGRYATKWSPTENKIAYIHGPHWDISVRDYPGTDSAQPLTEDGPEDGICTSLVWSRDGTKIAYVQEGMIKIMNADGGNKRELSPDKPIEPISKISDWSPDGSKLMVISGEEPRAYTIDVQTNHAQLLPIGEEALCWNAVWSTDGSKILYVTFNFDRYELWIMNEDGMQRAAALTKDITHYANFIGSIVWSKDEFAVLFVGSDKFFGSDRDIYMMRMELR